MQSPIRVLFLGLNLVVFALLVIVGTPAAVTPAIAAPLALVSRTDYASRSHEDTSPPAVLVKHVTSADVAKRDGRHEMRSDGADSVRSRDINTVLGDVNILNNYYEQMSQHAANFRQLHQTPASSRSADFDTQSADEVSAFSSNLNGFQDILAQLAADKGLANYDRSDDLETLLKDLVNAVKYLLSDVTQMVYELPAVGGTLGPIVYDIKCLLDETLDAVENLTDGIINAIEPLLKGLISDASKTACGSGIAIIGFCII